jgi:hypothetical protein
MDAKSILNHKAMSLGRGGEYFQDVVSSRCNDFEINRASFIEKNKITSAPDGVYSFQHCEFSSQHYRKNKVYSPVFNYYIQLYNRYPLTISLASQRTTS